MPFDWFQMIVPKENVGGAGRRPNLGGAQRTDTGIVAEDGTRYESYLQQQGETFVRVDELSGAYKLLSVYDFPAGGVRVAFGGRVDVDFSAKVTERQATSAVPRYTGTGTPEYAELKNEVSAVMAEHSILYMRASNDPKDERKNYYISMKSLIHVMDLVQYGVLPRARERRPAERGAAVRINDWLVGHKVPSGSGGRAVSNFPYQERYDFIEKVVRPYYNYSTSPDWYMREFIEKTEGETYLPINSNAYNKEMTKYAVGHEDVRAIECDAWADQAGRYWIAVGPAVMGASYDSNKAIDPKTMKYGCKVDVHLQHTINSGEVWLYCIVGDAKNHTRDGVIHGSPVDGKGFYQTGFGYRMDGSKEFASESVDASIIEFMGRIPRDELKNMANYKVVEMIVYDND